MKHLIDMTLKDKIEELLNNEPKTMFRITQLLPSVDDGCPDEAESKLLDKLHKAKFVCTDKRVVRQNSVNLLKKTKQIEQAGENNNE